MQETRVQSGRSPGEANDNLLQDSGLENPQDRGPSGLQSRSQSRTQLSHRQLCPRQLQLRPPEAGGAHPRHTPQDGIHADSTKHHTHTHS